jgi:predicted RNA binding protein YcfA (HicA-like mRNA interferase family)
MANQYRLLSLILNTRASANMRFDELRRLMRDLGFAERIRGSHHIFSRADIDEIINLQPKNGKAKVYQVRQVRALIRHYQLGTPNDE